MTHLLANKKKVLIIAYFFPPLGGGGVQRTVKFVKYLRDFGYEPTILTVKKGKHSVDDTSFDRDVPKDVRIIRTNFIGLFAPKKKKALANDGTKQNMREQKSATKKILASLFHFVERFFFVPDIQMLWRPFANRAVLRLLRKEAFDVIYSTSSPFTDHLIGRDIHRITGVPWVADFRDHWTLAPTYEPASILHEWIDRHLEETILHEASGVIFNTETNRNNIREAFCFVPKRSAVIYNGFDPSDFDDTEFKNNEIIEARYIGSYYGKEYSAKEIIAALNIALKNLPKLHVTFIGDIDRHSREIISSSPFFGKNIFLAGYVPHTEITRFTQQATFLILTLPNIPKTECWVPQKLYEYIGSGRPTFALAQEHGEVATILRRTEAGNVVAQSKSSNEIASALVAFVKNLEINNFKSQVNHEAVAAFERKSETKQLAEFLNLVLYEA